MKIYLASPYSHKDAHVREQRYESACKKTAELIEDGDIVFSPIAHSHNIAKYIGNHNDSSFWVDQDLSFLTGWADEMWVLMLDGWEESKGIKMEMQASLSAGIIVKYVEA